MKKLLIIIIFINTLCLAQKNEFDKYGPFGSQVFTDLKLALEVEKNVYKLDISYKKIEPKVYAKLGKLKDLQALKLSGNEITNYPANFGELFNLLYLTLSVTMETNF